MKYLYFLTLAFLLSACSTPEKKAPKIEIVLNSEITELLSDLALSCIHTEFPNKLGHVIVDSSQVKRPINLHPAFYGCFDWHSSVHGHWMLIKLLKEYPKMKNRDEIRAAISSNISKENIEAEIEYFNGKLHNSFERTYGWAWLFQLQKELNSWDDNDAKKWGSDLQPLTDLLRNRMIEFLPKLSYPIRTGVHPNTAFALSFSYDYAIQSNDKEFLEMIIKRAKDYYLFDKNYPAYLEPNGTDFFSPSLLEANLMHRVLGEEEYNEWFEKFLPELSDNLINPAMVSDRSDLSIVHLDGLNLSRAWCMIEISKKINNTEKKNILIESANRHLEDAMREINSGNYAGEHWLASFAIYSLTLK